MAAGLRPDPLGELKRSPDPLAAIRGPTSKGRGRETGGRGGERDVDGRGEGWKGKRRGREGKGREGKGACAVLTFPLKKPWP